MQEMTPEQRQANDQIMHRLNQAALFEKQVHILEGECSNYRTQLASVAVHNDHLQQQNKSLQEQLEQLAENEAQVEPVEELASEE